MEIIKRDYYIEKLLNFKNTNVAKVLIGIRKCGKTEILKQFINIVKTQGDTVLFYDLNDYDIRTKYIKEGVLYNEIKKNLKQTNKTYIFIDEVQEVERWDEVVNSLVRNKNIDLYITGSNSKVLSSNLPTILKGVTVPIYVFPLSFNEIKDHSSYKGKTDEFILEEYVRYGGMPGRLSFGTEQTLDYLKMVYSEILEVDILSKKIINNVDELIKIYNFILSNIGRVISTNNISLTLKNHNNTSIKNETVIKYAD
jgi:predicted AAA+ superfamily ATPase